MYSYCVYTNHSWAYWRFEETTNTFTNSMQAYDYSGNNFNATYGNSDGTSSSGCKDGGESILASLYGPGNSDSYSGFPNNNGPATMSSGHNNGYLTAPPLNLKTNTVTFTMWIYINSDNNIVTPNTGLFMNRNGKDAAGIGFGATVKTNVYGFDGSSVAELGYTWSSNSAASTGWHSGLYPCPGTWNFVACVITSNSTTMYLYFANKGSYGSTNLFKAVQNNVTNITETFSGGTTWIGGDNNDNARTFFGSIDEVAVFTNAMSESKIQDLFLKGLGLSTGVAPSFTTQPQTSVTIYKGQTLSMTAVAGGIPSPAFQWQYAQGGNVTLWTNVANSGTAITGATSNTLVMTGFPAAAWIARTNFQLVATNSTGSVTSSVVTVNYITIPNNSGIWTMNFAIATTNQSGTGTPFSGRGVLGTGTSWNALNAYSGQAFNVTAYRDDGVVTNSGIVFSSQGATGGSGSSLWTGVTNNMLLDTYIIVNATSTNPLPFVFSNIPNGKYNLALYGCVASWVNRAIQFTVLTNGVVAGTAAMTNTQDILFLPKDNTAVFTNLMVNNQRLEVDLIALPCPLNTNSTECEFNGAQLQLLANGVNLGVVSNQALAWTGGGLYTATNVSGPWVTNPGVSPLLLTNKIESKRYYKVFSPTPPY
jgi:hypothetical protein